MREGEPERPPVTMLVNPQTEAPEEAAAFIRALGGSCVELCLPEGEVQFQEFARSAARRGRRLVVVGGDGSVRAAIQTLAETGQDAELALLPFGTGNDLARSLGLAELDLAEATRIALEGRARSLDVVRLDLDDRSLFFANVANGGLGGQARSEVDDESKERMGSFAYWLAGAAAVTSPRSYRVELAIDGEETTSEVVGLIVANGRFVGGGFCIAPEADLSDGRLDVVVIPDLTTLEALAASVRYVLTGDPEETPARAARARRIEMRSHPPMPFSIDGELAECRSASFEILPGAFRIVGDDAATALDDGARSRDRSATPCRPR